MNVDSSVFALTQIDLSVRNLNLDNLEHVWSLVSYLIELYGSSAERQFLRSLISTLVLQSPDSSELLPQSQQTIAARSLLTDKYQVNFTSPHFKTALCQCIGTSGQPPVHLLSRLFECLQFNILEQVICLLAVYNRKEDSTDCTLDELLFPKIKSLVEEIITEKEPNNTKEALIKEFLGLHEILVFISIIELPIDVILPEDYQRFLEVLKEQFSTTSCPQALLPFLYSNISTGEEASIYKMEADVTNSQNPAATFDPGAVEFVLEHGTGICATVEECRTTLLTIGANKITTAAVARIMNGMIKAQDIQNQNSQQQQNIWGDSPSLSSLSGGKDKGSSDSATSWNGKVFVQAVLEVVPTMVWKDVFRELDFPGFSIRDGRGFRALIDALKYGLQIQGLSRPEQFPIDTFYRRWINTEGQLSLIRACLNPNNTDVFSFSDHSFRAVSTEVLKTTGDKSYDVKEIVVWKSIDLLDLLLNLSDGGHYPVIQEMFQFPVNHCPDILVLGLIQISSPMNVLRTELMQMLFPVFLGNHINSGVILQYSWHNGSNAIRPLMIHAMAEWYMRGDYDQTKLSRILDVAQDLKALHLLLNANSYVFIIDLACLASRREFLKLDKWLTDKTREHGEPFVKSLVKVMNRRVPFILGKEENVPKSAQLPPETVSTLIQCLHQCVGKVNQELSDTIVTIVSTYNMILNKTRVPPPIGGPQPPPGVLRPQHRTLSSLEGAFNGNPSSGPGQLFPSQSDPLSVLGSNFAGINLTGGSSAGSFGYNPLGPTPGSPSRLLGPGFNSQNPAVSAASYPMLTGGLQIGPIPTAGGGGSGPSAAAVSAALMGGIGNPMGMLGARLGPNPQGPTGGGPAPSAIGSGPGDKRGGALDNTLLFSDTPGDISKEAEEETNNYFHRIYSNPPDPTMSIDEVLGLLKRFQESSVRREREVFTCMLKNLFEEYKFFPQYPDKELHTTAQLFGGIIEHGLVTTYLQLGYALRIVVDALKKSPGSKMYFFGLAALDRFKNKLKEYPQYCQHLSTIPHFQEFPSHLIEYIEYGARSQEPPRPRTGPIPMAPVSSSTVGAPTSATALPQHQPPGAGTIGLGNKTSAAPGPGVIAPKSSSSVVPGPSISGRPSIANATNITTLLVATEKDEKITPPPEGVQDKTAFIFNNLNQMNLTQKCEELKDIIGTDYWPWVAQYLVMKRASIELNFHSLYSNLLDTLKAKELNSCVLRETHRNIRILLRTDKSAGNFSDRALLKNLGHWLGMITVLKNKPIILDDLDIKSLIIEAYRKGLQDLLYVVPFAAKIMESCTRSKVFSPPCPWTMGILYVLGELHQEPDMKLNLKFEIEVLCKAFNLELRELTPPGAGVLKDEAEFKIDVYQLSYSTEKRGIPTPEQNNQGRSKLPPASTDSDAMKTKYNFSQLFAMQAISKPSQALPEVNQSQQQQQQQQFHSSTALPIQPPSHSLDDLSSVSSTSPPMSQGSSSQPAMTGLSSTPTLPVGAPEPKFSFMDIDIANLPALMVNVSINNQLPLFQSHPQLKQYVRPAVEKAVQDLLHPVVDRSIKYTINACDQIIKKDFALDYDENRMRVAAHHMIRYLTAGMAMITSRDHIYIAISTNLKTVFLAQSRSPSSNQQLKDMIEQASVVLANDNMELACVFIQKTAVEKSFVEIDKKLATEFEIRKQAKAENRRYFDPAMNSYQSERIPEPIRVKPTQPGGPVSQQLAVYEDFSRNIPGFIPPSDGEVPFLSNRFPTGMPPPGAPGQGAVPTVTNVGPPNAPGTGEDLLSIYDKLVSEMDNYLQGLAVSHSPASPQLAQGVKNLLDAIMSARQSKSVVSAITLLQKAVEGLLEGLAAFPSDPEIIRYRDAHLMVLKGLQDTRGFGQAWVNRQVTKCLIESRPEVKYNVDAVDTLIRANLVNMIQFDAHLSNAMDKGTNVMAVNFAMQLVQMYLVDERFNTTVTESDLYHTVDMLSRVATVNRQHPEGLLHLIEILRNHETPNFAGDRAPPGVPTSNNLHVALSQTRDFDDSQDLRSGVSGSSGLMEKSEILFREWIRLYVTQGSPRDSNKAFAAFIHDLNSSGILKSDDVITRFFRVCVQFCVSQVYQGLQAGKAASPAMPLVRGKCYQSVDALVRLVALLIRHIGDSVTVQPKINLLNKFLGIVAGLLIQDHELQKSDFQQLPFHRLFIMLFQDLNQADPVFDAIGMQILAGFSNILHILNPHKVSGFVYSWLEIIGNRTFIARMLALAADQKCWAMYCQLLLDLFKFLQPYLRNADLAKPVATLYRGTLRVLLVILHDFPDFLCDYCYHFLDAIPPNCIQMRNLVLSAFPRNMRLPDPFTANLKFEMLPDSAMPPRVILNFGGMIQPAKFKQDLDSYLKTRAPVTFLSELRTNLQVTTEMETRYNIPLLNALVLYVGSQHINAIRARGQTPSMSTIAHTSHMDIFQNLAVDLDTEGRYLFLNALANQLRFPSSHTHYFSLVILYLFVQSNTEVVQEQITRVLLERLVVNRPHPWGLLVTFIELIKNPVYKFWQHEFVHCAPEVEKLFESVARSCMVTKNTPVPHGSGPNTLTLSTSAQNVPLNPTGLMSMEGGGDMMNLENLGN